MKGILVALGVIVLLWQLDQHLSYGKYTDALFAMLRQMRHSFTP
jgi:hypothetical protein